MNTERRLRPLAERDGLAAQVVAEAATYREPLPDSAHELMVKSVGPVFPFLSRNWARTYPSKGVIQQIQ